MKTIFQNSYSRENFTQLVRNIYSNTYEALVHPEPIDEIDKNIAISAFRLGTIKLNDGNEIAVYETTLTPNCNLSRNRVGVRNLLRNSWKFYDGAFIASYKPNDNEWRFSFLSETKGFDESGEYKTQCTQAKRYTYLFGKEHPCRTATERFKTLQASEINLKSIIDAFSVEALSKDFYKKLYNWYEWAMEKDTGVTFPDTSGSTATEAEDMNVKIIRMITRILFVWFIKQKKLVNDALFDAKELKNILRDFDPKATDNGNYYNAILQNLFFATLNRAIIDEEGNPRRFANLKNKRDLRTLYRYEEMFQKSENEVIELFDKIPFLNGGLFECLDKFKGVDIQQETNVYFDGFSRNDARDLNGNYKYRAFVPNILFFNTDETKDEKHLGLFQLLSQYNFTIEENSTDDAQVSLDPELLGRVFENLLASYNPETQESARKSTGSFYTPREIVNYMVDESLIQHLTQYCPDIESDTIRQIFDSHQKPTDLTKEQSLQAINALKTIKILDPACGSGAFPMGCLLRMVEIIELMQGHSENRYELKLHIIENCIYGIDIQSIAMLISKLRFFISLICEQKNVDFYSPETNYGINTLPNLETKFVAANTLISADIHSFDNDWTNDSDLNTLKNELLNIRHEHFRARSSYKKQKIKNDDEIKREEILNHILKTTSKPDEEKISRWQREIEKKQLETLNYQGEKWEEEWTTPQGSLFEVAEPTLFKRDVNKEKRDKLEKEIQNLQAEIRKEEEKGMLYGFEAAVEQVTRWNPYDQNASSPFFDPEWMFGVKDGFDIVIGNPPYISTKGVSAGDKKKYEAEFGFSDDTYYLFTVKGLQLANYGGTLNYIIPKTFWTTQTKRGMRDLLLKNSIIYIFDTANPFEAAMVDTCVIQVRKKPLSNGHKVRFLDGSNDLIKPIKFPDVEQQVWLDTQNSVIFKPTDLNSRIHKKYGKIVKELYDTWWDKIKTSRDIEKNKDELEKYRNSLKPGDVALLGCLTEGGQGLATANNGKYISVRKSTKWAKSIKESRPKKLQDAFKKNKKIVVDGLNNPADADMFLASMSEKEIAALFDSLKEQYGRDIFGQGYIYKLIDDTELADVDNLTQDEKDNGIDSNKNFWVPYDKGDKDGNRWYLETPFAIAWNKENVRFLKTDPKARYQGYAFFFREGFTWIFTLNEQAEYQKSRIKPKSVNDVNAMSLFPFDEMKLPSSYFVCLLNAWIIFKFKREFINSTSAFQINDARQLPIIIPTTKQLEKLHSLFNEAIAIKKNELKTNNSNLDNTDELKNLQIILDDLVRDIYGL
ncbi:MAG: Eco57I restriction-modification methylase domain-containing protein [Proteiniphilum sp.]|nr:Eco57I restriction-modification methylase domain-containing protein [Proteiniphilum sp.]